MARLICASLFVCVLASASFAQVLSVELSGPAVPSTRVEHVIERSQGTLVARVGRFLPDGFGRREAVGLLTEDELTALVAALDRLGAFSLPSAKARGARATWKVRLEVPDRTHVFEVANVGVRPDGRHRAVIDLLRTTIEAKTGPAPVQDDRLLAEEAGVVQVETDVPARVVVVGEGFAGMTPLRALRLPAGQHTLELVPVAGGEPVRHPIRVDAGRTTRLNLELK